MTCALEEGDKSGLSGSGNLFTKAYNNNFIVIIHSKHFWLAPIPWLIPYNQLALTIK